MVTIFVHERIANIVHIILIAVLYLLCETIINSTCVCVVIASLLIDVSSLKPRTKLNAAYFALLVYRTVARKQMNSAEQKRQQNKQNLFARKSNVCERNSRLLACLSCDCF